MKDSFVLNLSNGCKVVVGRTYDKSRQVRNDRFCQALNMAYSSKCPFITNSLSDTMLNISGHGPQRNEVQNAPKMKIVLMMIATEL